MRVFGGAGVLGAGVWGCGCSVGALGESPIPLPSDCIVGALGESPTPQHHAPPQYDAIEAFGR